MARPSAEAAAAAMSQHLSHIEASTAAVMAQDAKASARRRTGRLDASAALGMKASS